jgi:phenylacetate-coenzyme A ligase PaaK-like adenylate-forming protein
MEYGSVETGLIAHTHPEGGYRVFWRTYFVEAEKADYNPMGFTVRITSLYPRCFPLVRYEIGDEITLRNQSNPHVLGIATFEKVLGRCNDYVQLQDGSMIHSETFTHAIRWCSDICAYQVLQNGKNVQIHYMADRDLSSDNISQIRGNLLSVHPDLGQILLKRVDKLEQTIAGKTRMVVRN